MNTGRIKSNSISSLHRAFRRNCFRFHLSLTVHTSFLLGDNKIIVFIKNGEILLRCILHISSIHFAMGKKIYLSCAPKSPLYVLVVLGELDSTLPDIEKLSDDFLEKNIRYQPFYIALLATCDRMKKWRKLTSTKPLAIKMIIIKLNPRCERMHA